MSHSARVGRVADVALRFGLLIMVGAMLLVFWGGLAVFHEVQRQRLLEQNFRDLRLVNGAVAQHAAGLFKAVETDLRMLELWLRAHPGTDPLGHPDFIALASEMRRSANDAIDLRLVDQNGILYTLPWREGRFAARVDDRDYVVAQREPGRPAGAMYIGHPVRSRVDGEWGIPVSRRIDPAVGRFWLATAVVRIDPLMHLHERFRYQPGGSILLMREDSVLLSRAPFDDRFLGNTLRRDTVPVGALMPGPGGTFTTRSDMTDGVPRFGSYERLDDFPVTVVVTRSVDEVMGPFEARTRIMAAAGGFLTLCVIAFTTFLHRSQRALRGAQDDLQRLATIDELTGTLNRRALGAFAEQEFLRARRFGRPMTVLALDIDHFKAINDRRGHAAGDSVLRECTDRWRRVLRGPDVLGRLGGEEFCVLLAETPPTVAAAVAERLRAAIADAGMTHQMAVTVSIGLATVNDHDQHWSDTLERADRALYAAKHAGRNRVASLD